MGLELILLLMALGMFAFGPGDSTDDTGDPADPAPPPDEPKEPPSLPDDISVEQLTLFTEVSPQDLSIRNGTPDYIQPYFGYPEFSNETFTVEAAPGLTETAYTLASSAGNDVFDVQAGARVEPNVIDDYFSTPPPDDDVISVELTADAIAALGQDGYENGLIDRPDRVLVPKVSQPAAPKDVAVFVNLSDPDDTLALSIDPAVDGFVHAFDLTATISNVPENYLVYVLTDSAATPIADEVFGTATVDPETGDVTTTDPSAPVLAIVQTGDSTDPQISLNREVTSTQDLSLQLSNRVGEVAPPEPDPDRPADLLTLETDSFSLLGTEADDVFVMPEAEGSSELHTLLFGFGGDDYFQVGGGAAVDGGGGTDTISAAIDAADLADLPEPFFNEPEYGEILEPAALNVELLDENDVVVISLDDDVGGFIHRIETTTTDDVVYPAFLATRYTSGLILFVRSDSAEAPDVSGEPETWTDVDLVASIRVSETTVTTFDFLPPGSDPSISSDVNENPQIFINREITTTQVLTGTA